MVGFTRAELFGGEQDILDQTRAAFEAACLVLESMMIPSFAHRAGCSAILPIKLPPSLTYLAINTTNSANFTLNRTEWLDELVNFEFLELAPSRPEKETE